MVMMRGAFLRLLRLRVLGAMNQLCGARFLSLHYRNAERSIMFKIRRALFTCANFILQYGELCSITNALVIADLLTEHARYVYESRATHVRVSRRRRFSFDVDAIGLLFEYVDSNTRFYAPTVRSVYACSFFGVFNSSSTKYGYT